MHPFLNIFGLKFPSYGLSIVIAILLVCFFAYRSIRRDKSITNDDAPVEYLVAIVSICMISFLLGAKLLYIIVTYDFSEIAKSISEFDFSFMTGAGLVFYGGLIFGILGAFGAARCAKVDLLRLERHIVPFIPLGHAIGRIGCLLCGCCYGMEYNGIGAIYYKSSLLALPSDVGFFPVQPLEAILDVGIMIFLLSYTKKERPRGNVLFMYLLLYSVIRFITEIFRGDAHRGIYAGLSTSQWISIALLLICLIRLFITKAHEKKVN